MRSRPAPPRRSALPRRPPAPRSAACRRPRTAIRPEWERLRERLFPGRAIEDGDASQVQLIVPLRAAYGASVPVKVVSKLPQAATLSVVKLTVLVDKNPSPVAAVLDLTPAVGQADFETRLRVDEYCHVRVVSELSNGELHMDSRFVKVSGGCSAPPNRDSPHLIGKTILKLPDGLKANQPTVADVTVLHPNDTGFELNQVTVMYIPPHFVRAIRVSCGGQRVFDADLDFSVSENPDAALQLRAAGRWRRAARGGRRLEGRPLRRHPAVAGMKHRGGSCAAPPSGSFASGAAKPVSRR